MPGEGTQLHVLRPPARGEFYGDRARADSLPVHHTIDDVLVEWSSGPGAGSQAAFDRRETTTSQPTAYCEAGSDVLPTDYARIGDTDVVYKVVGVPEPWAYGGWEPGVVVRLKAVR